MARAEEGPPDVPLVVLGPRKGERHHEDQRVVRERAAARRLRQRGWPRRVPLEEGSREGVRLPPHQLPELEKDVIRKEGEARLDLLGLLVLGDVERVVVPCRGRGWGVGTVGIVWLDSDVRGGHQLRVRAEREARARGALSRVARFGFDELPGRTRAHREPRYRSFVSFT